MRATLIPSIPHMDLTVVCGALVFLLALFWFFGQRGFMKRAIT
jgi:hypothetical protein